MKAKTMEFHVISDIFFFKHIAKRKQKRVRHVLGSLIRFPLYIAVALQQCQFIHT